VALVGTARPSRRRPTATTIGGGLALVAAVVAPLLRQRGAPSWDTIWGEDGWVYFQQAHDHGLSIVLRGYAGYLQLTPRLLAIPTALVPVREVAAYFALVGAVVGAALAWFVYWATAGWIRSRPVRLALAALVVLLPVLGYENTANATNTIWVLYAVTPWALVATAEDRRGVWLRSVVAFAGATATALSAIFIPLAIVVAVRRRQRPGRIVCLAYGIGLALQFAVVSHTRDTRPHVVVRQASTLPQIIGVKVFGQLLVGDRGIRALWDHRSALAVVAPLLVLGLIAALLPGLSRRRAELVVAFTALAVIAFVVPVWGRGTNQVALALRLHSLLGPAQAGHYNPMSSRYSVAPVFLLASALAVGVGGRRVTAWTAGLRAAFVVWAVVVCAAGYSVVNLRSAGPRWTATIDRAARTHCAGQPASTKVKLTVPNRPVNPAVVVSCGELGRPPGPRHPTDGTG
jgi:hypothetical protein